MWNFSKQKQKTKKKKSSNKTHICILTKHENKQSENFKAKQQPRTHGITRSTTMQPTKSKISNLQ